ncbi:MAG: hypothetical protein Q7S56_01790 [Nanoarchaeota archaeon]|nr:hypothetical protein [Nanoarchaeota archaeon]
MLVKQGLIIFLVEYARLSSSSSIKEAIESIFSIAVYDYLGSHANELDGEKSRLEAIAQEFLKLEERTETRKLILEITKGKHKKLYQKLKPFLLPLIYEDRNKD